MGQNRGKLTATDAAIVVVGIVFGSGIFLAPSVVAQFCGSKALSLLAWPLGALIAVCGSLCYAECISRVNAEGGFYAVFRHTFGESFATSAGLVSQLVLSPAALAGPVTIGGTAIAASYFGQGKGSGQALACSLALLVGACACNVFGVHFSKMAQRVFVAAKVLLVAFLVLACLASHAGLVGHNTVVITTDPNRVAQMQGWGLMAVFLGELLWTFDGWTDVTMIAPKLHRPGADLSKALILGLFGLAGIFVAVQYAVMQILGVAGTAASVQPFSDAIQAVFGSSSKPLVQGAIVLSTFTSAHGVMWMVSSLTQVMSRQGALPRVLARTDSRLGKPVCCVLFVTSLAASVCLLRDFDAIVALFTFFIWIFYGLMAISLAMLRRRGVRVPGTWIAPGGPVPLCIVGAAACLMATTHVLAFPWTCAGLLAAFMVLWAGQRYVYGQRGDVPGPA